MASGELTVTHLSGVTLILTIGKKYNKNVISNSFDSLTKRWKDIIHKNVQ